MEFQVSIGSY